MIIKNSNSGFAIAIAWPETYCKQPGYWYDGISNLLGWSKNYYYKVGHAALVLIDTMNRKCHYFDFGRYHTPFKQGRVRNATTDPGLAIQTTPVISENGKQIENFEEILTELQLNPECHGEGKLHASYCRTNFPEAFAKANLLLESSPIPYGPFKNKGSNCSRFVNTALLAGKPNWLASLKLRYLVPLTPMPLNNVKALPNKTSLPKMLGHPPFVPQELSDMGILAKTLPQPERHPEIPRTAQWLSGEGVGSWFHIVADDNNFFITRYNELGVLECKGRFEISNKEIFDMNLPYEFVHLSHCKRARIKQRGRIVEFVMITQ